MNACLAITFYSINFKLDPLPLLRFINSVGFRSFLAYCVWSFLAFLVCASCASSSAVASGSWLGQNQPRLAQISAFPGISWSRFSVSRRRRSPPCAKASFDIHYYSLRSLARQIDAAVVGCPCPAEDPKRQPAIAPYRAWSPPLRSGGVPS